MCAKINIHATGIQIGGIGVLVRGPTGAGKSLLALELLREAEQRGKAGLLVGDDRLDIIAGADHIEMCAPPEIAGKIELRGRGIVTRPFVARSRVDLVVDLVAGDAVERLPQPERSTCAGVELRRICIAPFEASACAKIRLAVGHE